jgi:hypothetical protein
MSKKITELPEVEDAPAGSLFVIVDPDDNGTKKIDRIWILGSFVFDGEGMHTGGSAIGIGGQAQSFVGADGSNVSIIATYGGPGDGVTESGNGGNVDVQSATPGADGGAGQGDAGNVLVGAPSKVDLVPEGNGFGNVLIWAGRSGGTPASPVDRGSSISLDAASKVEIKARGAGTESVVIDASDASGQVRISTEGDKRLQISSGGIEVVGQSSLKTHGDYAGSERVEKTGAVRTTNATPATLFNVALTDEYVYYLDVDVIARDEAGAGRGYFKSFGMVYREGGNAVLGDVSTTFYDRNINVAVQFTVSGTSILVEVVGVAATDISWVGTLRYQGVSTNA